MFSTHTNKIMFVKEESDKKIKNKKTKTNKLWRSLFTPKKALLQVSHNVKQYRIDDIYKGNRELMI